VRIFRRPRATAAPAPADPGQELRRTISGIAFLAEDETPGLARAETRARLLRIVSEAVILQDLAAEVLDDVRLRKPLAELAPRGGPLASRFFELRRSLPPPVDADTARLRDTVSVVLDHHGTLLVTALDMLAFDWRSPAIARQLERLDGLGTPAERLDAVYAELAADRAVPTA
jgi:hypothetical protein